MGSFILCHEKKANKPYYMDDIHLNLYTIEELCFYLCNNLFLLNHTLLSKDLCKWIDEELELPYLSASLLQLLPSMSLSRFVVTILSYVGFCDDQELEDIQHTLMSLKDETEEEQRKKKADNMLKNGKYESSLREYERILKKEGESKLGRHFYARIRHNMGVAYAKQFLFGEAASCFEQAYNLDANEESLKEYLCACYMSMDDVQFRQLVEDNGFEKMAERMKETLGTWERQYRFFQEQNQREHRNIQKRIEECKEEYRRSLL